MNPQFIPPQYNGNLGQACPDFANP